MSPKEFLRKHWQKRPLVIRQALPNFVDPIAPDELAGLACEEGVESRIVKGELADQSSKKRGSGAKTKRNAPWEVVWGPHPESRFRTLPDHGWTLLVQEVNRWVPEAALLLDHFSFLPNVRVDDVMVSFAAKGGSVGPHVDSYDVFLLQGEGKRRWRFDTKKTKEMSFVEGLDLRILESFVLDKDVVLERGDILYLPPGFAHYGVSETRECLTYSIGFRSPRKSEAWASFAASRDDGDGDLLVDPPLTPLTNPGAIPKNLLERVRTMIRSMDTSNDAIDRWFASYSTRLKPGHAIEPPQKALTEKTIFARLNKGDVLARSEEGRWAFLERKSALLLYVGGEEIEVEKTATMLAKRLCASRRYTLADLKNETRSAAGRRLLVQLIERGALYFTS